MTWNYHGNRTYHATHTCQQITAALGNDLGIPWTPRYREGIPPPLLRVYPMFVPSIPQIHA